MACGTVARVKATFSRRRAPRLGHRRYETSCELWATSWKALGPAEYQPQLPAVPDEKCRREGAGWTLLFEKRGPFLSGHLLAVEAVEAFRNHHMSSGTPPRDRSRPSQNREALEKIRKSETPDRGRHQRTPVKATRTLPGR